MKKESSTVAASVKGFSAPFGVSVVRRKNKKKNNLSKPYGEPELFENAVASALLDSDNLDEVVVKVGNKWVIKNDKTGSTMGSYDSREAAWEKQRLLRKQKKREGGQHHHHAATASKPKKASGSHKAPKAQLAPKSQKAPKPHVHKEQVMNKLKSVLTSLLKEGSMISYVFEQGPSSEDSLGWERFISKLSRETVLSDPKLKSILQDVAKNEVKILSSAVDAVAKILESTGAFSVEKKGVDQDDSGDIALYFDVKMGKAGKSLPFAVKIENARPVILFPEESKNALNALATDESKLLRAELMHAQETALDNMHDVANATQKRDEYLKDLESKVDQAINGMSPLEVAMIRHLLKNKYRSVK